MPEKYDPAAMATMSRNRRNTILLRLILFRPFFTTPHFFTTLRHKHNLKRFVLRIAFTMFYSLAHFISRASFQIFRITIHRFGYFISRALFQVFRIITHRFGHFISRAPFQIFRIIIHRFGRFISRAPFWVFRTVTYHYIIIYSLFGLQISCCLISSICRVCQFYYEFVRMFCSLF